MATVPPLLRALLKLSLLERISTMIGLPDYEERFAYPLSTETGMVVRYIVDSWTRGLSDGQRGARFYELVH
jgi:hypothetical protein